MRPRSIAARAVLSAILAAAMLAGAQAATSPFGVATPDTSAGTVWVGPFQDFANWAMAMQSSFYKRLTAALGQFSDNRHAGWWLIGLSFLYGVFHAVGPGHGKAVISSYLVATGKTARRAVAISFAAALTQALSAILLVAVATVLLRATAMTITRVTDTIALASYSLIVLLGAMLLWRKALAPALAAIRPAPQELVAAGAGGGQMHLSEIADHHHGDHHHHHHHDHEHYGAASSLGDHHRHGAQCGCRHTVEPETLNKSLSASHVAATILAIGVRPCSGALIVLVFALSQKLFLVGALSTVAMGIGTGLTVSALAVFATMARQTALRAAGTGSFWAAGAVRAMEIGGALTILAFGAVMLAGALAN